MTLNNCIERLAHYIKGLKKVVHTKFEVVFALLVLSF